MYTDFAYIYDTLMYDVNYAAWADYIIKLFSRYKVQPSLVLDLGCGTGSLTVEMAGRGYDMIGVDLSTDMLSCAIQKAEEKGRDVLFLHQDMRAFELYGTVDAVLCMMDSINYITDKRDLRKVFKLVANYLNPGGVFIFDINTPYKFEHILAENVYYDLGDEVTYIWQNRYDKKSGQCVFELTFFVKEEGAYQKYDEEHTERAYHVEELAALLASAGLEVKGVFDALKLIKPHAKSERVFIVAAKENKEGR